MFPLPKPARSIVLTGLLALLTLVPTVCVLVFIARVKHPGHLREVETELGRELGLHVTLTGVKHVRPETDELTGLVLRREESSGGTRLVEIARADRLLTTREAGRIIIRAEGLVLRGEHPAELADSWLALTRRLAASGKVELLAPAARIDLRRDGEDISQTVEEFAAVAGSRGKAFELSTSYRVGGSEIPSRCEIRLTQNAAETQPRTDLSIQTMEGDLPISALASLIDAEKWFGSQARLRGEVKASWGPRTPETLEFQGEIRQVSLQQLLEQHFPGRRLRGTAQIQVEKAVWSDLPGTQGRGWSLVKGQIESGTGWIGRELLAALVDSLGFRLARPDLPGSEDLTYQRLGLGFALNDQGELTLVGAAGGENSPDTVLASLEAAEPIVLQPEGTASVRGLWKALLPWDTDVLVPATSQSHVLRYLPMPQYLTQPQRSMPAN